MELVLIRRRLRRPQQRGGLYALRFAVAGLFTIFFSLIGSAAVAAFVLYGLYASYIQELPSAEEIGRRSVESFETTRLYDRTGQVVLYEIIPPDGERRTEVPLHRIPEHLRNATIAMEDRTFYTNPGGINWVGLGRAAMGLVRGEDEGGGSSIAQQLVRNVIMTFEERAERSYTRKVREVVLAIELTRRYPGIEGRDQILEWYLNNISYGYMANGVQAAAQTYFSKNVEDLTLAESAMLVPLGNSPARNPIDRPEEAKRRQEIVLDEMYLQGYITSEEALAAKQEPLIIVGPRFDMIAPHYVLYVREQLVRQFGESAVYGGGLQVITAIDLDAQRKAEEIAREQIDSIRETYNATNTAVAVIHNETAELRAMVGSVDFYDASIDGQVNIALSPRQPGSSFKPYTYATAFAQGLTPATMIMDVRTSFPDPPNPTVYVPENINRNYNGPITLRRALANSLNIPAVALMHQVGVMNVVRTARAMGVTSLNEASYGLAIALGAAEISPLDMAYAFSVFANEGVLQGTLTMNTQRAPGLRQVDPVSILKVTSAAGQVLYEYADPQRQDVLRPEVAFLITDVLSDNAARSATFGANSLLRLGDRPAAVKTGTTNDFRDAWAVGYTPQYTTSVWVGNADNTKMRNAPGSRVAAPIWNALMTYLHEDLPVESFRRPAGIVTVVVDSTSGKLPTEYSPRRVQELFMQGTEPTEYDDVHRPFAICDLSGRLATPYCPPETVSTVVYDIYPPEADDWVRTQEIPQPPREVCDLHGPSFGGSPVAIIDPTQFGAVAGVVPVRGNAQPDGFERFWLEYGEGEAPANWVRIGGEYGHTVHGDVLEHWNTAGLVGLQTLRLTVVAHGALHEFRVQVVVDNIAPTVRIVGPYNGQSFSSSDEWVTAQANAEDNTSMDRVEFYLNDELRGFSTVAPYTMRWRIRTNPEVGSGTYKLHVVAYDRAGNASVSEPVTFTVR